KFRKAAPYITKISSMVYNKLYMCETIFPEEVAEKLSGMFKQDGNYKRAKQLIEKNSEEIQKEKEYYQGIFTRSLYDFVNHFDVYLP
ncbi:MAG: hypothetical protein ACTSWQ_05855, partial [Candidatus Thorarchaeota archaeon]